MKLYKFYHNSPNEDETNQVDTTEDAHPLIGYTNDKKIREMYIKTRNPKSFIEIITKVTKEEYVDFANCHNGQKLDIYDYSDPSYTSTRDAKMSEIPIVTSWFEKENVSMVEDNYISYILENAVRCDIIFPFVFKSKFVKALEKLEFISFWKLLGGPQAFEKVMTEDEIESCDDYEAPSIIWNELNSLIDDYQDYFLYD